MAGIFSTIMPYPVISNHTNITESDAYNINNYYETEISSQTAQSSQLLTLDFDVVDCLLPNGTEFEIYDFDNEMSFTVQRTGGKNHIDIEPIDEENSQIFSEICDYAFSWQRRPVLVKINENAYLPASICQYPHGYVSIENGLNGHLCLHFLSSKTDGTNEEDFQHQRCVKYAISHGKKLIEKLSDLDE